MFHKTDGRADNRQSFISLAPFEASSSKPGSSRAHVLYDRTVRDRSKATRFESGETLRGCGSRASTTVAVDVPPRRVRTGRKSCARRLLSLQKPIPRVSVVSHSPSSRRARRDARRLGRIPRRSSDLSFRRRPLVRRVSEHKPRTRRR